MKKKLSVEKEADQINNGREKSTLRHYGLLVFGVLLYRGILEYSYTELISPLYAYSGFVCQYDMAREILSWLASVIAAIFIAFFIERKRLSDIIVALLTLMAFIPAMVLYTYTDTPFIGGYFLYWGILLSAQSTLLKNLKIAFPRKGTSHMAISGIIFLSVLIVVYVSGRYTGFRIQSDVIDVYGVRAEAAGYNMPVVLRYAFSMIKVVIPTMVVYMLSQKRYALAATLALTQFLLFSVDGSKTAFFMIFVAITGYMLINRHEERLRWIPWGLGGVCALGLWDYSLRGSITIASLFTRRLLFVPAVLNYDYYQFFSQPQNPFDYFRQGILGKLGFSSPYNQNIARMIGEMKTNANNGLFSDAYANLGEFGMIVMPLIVVIMLSVMDQCARGLEKKMLIAVMASVTFALISSSFFTVMLTHGFLALCIVLLFLPRKEERQPYPNK